MFSINHECELCDGLGTIQVYVYPIDSDSGCIVIGCIKADVILHQCSIHHIHQRLELYIRNIHIICDAITSPRHQSESMLSKVIGNAPFTPVAIDRVDPLCALSLPKVLPLGHMCIYVSGKPKNLLTALPRRLRLALLAIHPLVFGN